MPHEEAITIRDLVAHGGPVPADQVTLADDLGNNLLDAPNDAGVGGQTETRRLQDFLDAAYGAGATVATVKVETSAGSSTTVERKRVPLSGAAIESKEVSTSATYGEKGQLLRGRERRPRIAAATRSRRQSQLPRRCAAPQGGHRRLQLGSLEPQRDRLDLRARSEGRRRRSHAGRHVHRAGRPRAPCSGRRLRRGAEPSRSGGARHRGGALRRGRRRGHRLRDRPRPPWHRPTSLALTRRWRGASRIAPAAPSPIALEMPARELYERVKDEPPHVVASMLRGVPLQTAQMTLEYFRADLRREIEAASEPLDDHRRLVKQLQGV